MPTAPPFVHLHCHSDYSLLDGAVSVKALVARAKELGMSAVALTDHGNLYGAIEFYRACHEASLRPILGYEAYVAPGSRFDPDGDPYHLTLLAQNREGFRNLVKLSSYAFRDGLREMSPSARPIPCIDKELLEAHSEGVVCLSGSPRGELPACLMGADTLARGAEVTTWFRRVFGERYYLELQPGAPAELTQRLVELAQREGIPLVATGDVHYLEPADAAVHAVLNAIRDGRTVSEAVLADSPTPSFHFRTAEEMVTAFPDALEAVARSQQVADSCVVDLELGKRRYRGGLVPPTTPAEADSPDPDQHDTDRDGPWLDELVIPGLRERYAAVPERWQDGDPASGSLDGELRRRVAHEVFDCHRRGSEGTLLLAAEVVRLAAEAGITCRARGDVVGTLLGYALRLHDLCPIEHGLLFEPFFVHRPAIRLEFGKERHAELLGLLRRRFGEANVARIGTLGRFGPRGAIRAVGEAMGMGEERLEALTALVPRELGFTLHDGLDACSALQSAGDADPDVRKCLELARRIEGFAQNTGVGAAVVVSSEPLAETVPLQKAPERDEWVTPWGRDAVERLGLPTIELLGLKELTLLDRCFDWMGRVNEERPNSLPLGDEATYELLKDGRTLGIQLFASPGFQELLRRVRPDNFLELSAAVALYQTGPMKRGAVDRIVEAKRGRSVAPSLPPIAQELLDPTYGVLVFREQGIQALSRLGRMTLGQSAALVEAVRLQDEAVTKTLSDEFCRGAAEEGFDHLAAQRLLEALLGPSADAMPQSLAASNAQLLYELAYLKAHHPAPFVATLLELERSVWPAPRLAPLVQEGRDLGLTIELLENSDSEGEYEVTIEPDKTPGCRHAHKIVVKRAPAVPNP